MAGIKAVRRRVARQVQGKDPKSVAWFFFDRSLVLLKEAGVSKETIIERLDYT